MGTGHVSIFPSIFQSTHPSGVRHLIERLSSVRRLISIHAPQWGATRDANSCWCCGRNFNPRTPVGCDPCGRHAGGACQQISIHAPQWGATIPRCGNSLLPVDFNPRTPVGCDPSSPPVRGWTDGFQSTHPSGVRQPDRRVRYHRRNFNPRTPVGCDSASHISSIDIVISIHAPQWGATRSRPVRRRSTSYFNPRTPVGCDSRWAWPRWR